MSIRLDFDAKTYPEKIGGLAHSHAGPIGACGRPRVENRSRRGPTPGRYIAHCAEHARDDLRRLLSAHDPIAAREFERAAGEGTRRAGHGSRIRNKCPTIQNTVRARPSERSCAAWSVFMVGNWKSTSSGITVSVPYDRWPMIARRASCTSAKWCSAKTYQAS